LPSGSDSSLNPIQSADIPAVAAQYGHPMPIERRDRILVVTNELKMQIPRSLRELVMTTARCGARDDNSLGGSGRGTIMLSAPQTYVVVGCVNSSRLPQGSFA